MSGIVEVVMGGHSVCEIACTTTIERLIWISRRSCVEPLKGGSIKNNQAKESYAALQSAALFPQAKLAGGSVLLTRSDLQAVLKLSARTITRLVATGGIPAPIVVGRSFRWRT